MRICSLTRTRVKIAKVLNEEVRVDLVHDSAYFLTQGRVSEDANDGDQGEFAPI